MVKYRHRWVPKVASPHSKYNRQMKSSRPLVETVPTPPPSDRGSAGQNSSPSEKQCGSPGARRRPLAVLAGRARAPTRCPDIGGHHFGVFCILAFPMHDINVHANFHHQCGYGMSIRMVKSKIHPRNAEISAHGVRG